MARNRTRCVGRRRHFATANEGDYEDEDGGRGAPGRTLRRGRTVECESGRRFEHARCATGTTPRDGRRTRAASRRGGGRGVRRTTCCSWGRAGNAVGVYDDEQTATRAAAGAADRQRPEGLGARPACWRYGRDETLEEGSRRRDHPLRAGRAAGATPSGERRRPVRPRSRGWRCPVWPVTRRATAVPVSDAPGGGGVGGVGGGWREWSGMMGVWRRGLVGEGGEGCGVR